VNVTSVAQEAAGLTADAIQQATWARADSGHDEDTLGYNVQTLHILHGQLLSATSTTQFILDAGVNSDIAYIDMLITLEDKTDNHYETRRIVAYTGASNEVFVDTAFGFTPATGDDYYICMSYAGVNVTHVEGTAQTAGDLAALIATAQADLNLLTGADGATLASAQGNYAPNVVVPDAAGVAPTAAEIKTAMEADAGDLSSLMEALVNKRIWTEANGNLEMFNDSDVSQGSVTAQVATDGTYTTAKRAFK
jgi:hypothetical protein